MGLGLGLGMGLGLELSIGTCRCLSARPPVSVCELPTKCCGRSTTTPSLG